MGGLGKGGLVDGVKRGGGIGKWHGILSRVLSELLELGDEWMQ